MASNREKGVVFIGLGKPPGFYENIVRNEFRDSKNIELKAVGRAIPRAIRISEKLTNASIPL
jgi:DNA-binding protein